MRNLSDALLGKDLHQPANESCWGVGRGSVSAGSRTWRSSRARKGARSPSSRSLRGPAQSQARIAWNGEDDDGTPTGVGTVRGSTRTCELRSVGPRARRGADRAGFHRLDRGQRDPGGRDRDAARADGDAVGHACVRAAGQRRRWSLDVFAGPDFSPPLASTDVIQVGASTLTAVLHARVSARRSPIPSLRSDRSDRAWTSRRGR